MTKLAERCQNRRKIVRLQIEKLFAHPNLTTTLVSLQDLLDATDDCIRQLTVLQQPVDSWDVLLMHIVYGKLDNATKADLEKQQYERTIDSATSNHAFSHSTVLLSTEIAYVMEVSGEG